MRLALKSVDGSGFLSQVWRFHARLVNLTRITIVSWLKNGQMGKKNIKKTKQKTRRGPSRLATSRTAAAAAAPKPVFGRYRCGGARSRWFGPDRYRRQWGRRKGTDVAAAVRNSNDNVDSGKKGESLGRVACVYTCAGCPANGRGGGREHPPPSGGVPSVVAVVYARENIPLRDCYAAAAAARRYVFI